MKKCESRSESPLISLTSKGETAYITGDRIETSISVRDSSLLPDRVRHMVQNDSQSMLPIIR